MVVAYRGPRLTACCDPLGAKREDHKDYIHVYDGSGMGHRTSAEQRRLYT